jgi:site-specific recombinase XerD
MNEKTNNIPTTPSGPSGPAVPSDLSVTNTVVVGIRTESVTKLLDRFEQLEESRSAKTDLQFEQARRERHAIYNQTKFLLAKLEEQTKKIDEQEKQLEELVIYQRIQNEKEALRQKLREKRSKAKKTVPRDLITPEEFDHLLQSIHPKPKAISELPTARAKVAYTLLYLTGLRVSNLLVMTVRHLRELIEENATRMQVIKGGGVKKIVLGKESKKWFGLIQPEIECLTHDKELSDFLFTSKQSKRSLSRQRFTEDLNEILKDFAWKSGKEMKTHSFRITLITELLRHTSIQKVKTIVGHKDIRTTELYNKDLLNEKDYYQAVQTLYKTRTRKTSISAF